MAIWDGRDGPSLLCYSSSPRSEASIVGGRGAAKHLAPWHTQPGGASGSWEVCQAVPGCEDSVAWGAIWVPQGCSRPSWLLLAVLEPQGVQRGPGSGSRLARTVRSGGRSAQFNQPAVGVSPSPADGADRERLLHPPPQLPQRALIGWCGMLLNSSLQRLHRPGLGLPPMRWRVKEGGNPLGCCLSMGQDLHPIWSPCPASPPSPPPALGPFPRSSDFRLWKVLADSGGRALGWRS